MKKGFSLLEVLLGMALVGILLGAANVFLFSSLRSAKKAEAVSTTKNEGAYAMNSMVNYIKFSRSIKSCTSTSLQFERVNGNIVTYTYTGNKIASSSPSLSSSIDLTSSEMVVTPCSGAIFTCPDKYSVKICFRLDRANSNVTENSANAVFESTVAIRNTDN